MNVFSNTALKGKTYLVTGASSGIGRATAIAISKCGARVIISGRDENKLKETLKLLEPSSEHVISVLELVDADKTADWIKQLSLDYGCLSGVFHAAGVELVRAARMTKQAHIDEVFGSSIYAAFGVARAVSQKNILTDEGSVVFMSSVAGSVGQQGLAAYSAAKAGIDGLVRSLACELAGRKIRVNSIVAGAVKTAMHERLTSGSGDEATNSYENYHLLGFGEVNDIANSVVFLLSDAGKWITGSQLVVDGGYTVR